MIHTFRSWFIFSVIIGVVPVAGFCQESCLEPEQSYILACIDDCNTLYPNCAVDLDGINVNLESLELAISEHCAEESGKQCENCVKKGINAAARALHFLAKLGSADRSLIAELKGAKDEIIASLCAPEEGGDDDDEEEA